MENLGLAMGPDIWQQGRGPTSSSTPNFWTQEEPCGPDDPVPWAICGPWARQRALLIYTIEGQWNVLALEHQLLTQNVFYLIKGCFTFLCKILDVNANVRSVKDKVGLQREV